MCLITTDRIPRRTDHPTFCWKMLVRRLNGDLSSPYMGAHYNVGETYKDSGKQDVKLLEPDELPKHLSYLAGKCAWEVDGGFIHAYKRLSVALKELKDAPTSAVVLCKCVVPAGTPHYISADGKEICARMMTLIEIVYPHSHKRIGYRLIAWLRRKWLRLNSKLLNC